MRSHLHGSPSIDVVHVVVPAHNEEQLIGRALAAIIEACHHAEAVHRGLVVRTTVVLDRCTDATEQSVNALGVDTCVIDAGAVGAARRAGVDHVAATSRDRLPERIWVACTDADSVVPPTWLTEHLRWAGSHDVVVGGVRPDPSETEPGHLAEWERRHRMPGRHVHGANLGFRLAAYLRTAGFEAVSEHEDVRLVGALESLGASIAIGTEVLTSSRHAGRTPGGFAGYMAEIAAELAPS
ncbi:glycosyltransferase family 2 protein [soil metagenome]